MTAVYESWGGVDRCRDVEVLKPRNSAEVERLVQGEPVGVFGNGRSYADQAIVHDGRLMDMRGLDCVINFDAATGVGVFEAGVLLGAIQRAALTRGFMLGTSPGTQFATLGGAIANDVHGKNHLSAGSLGCFVRALTLQKTNGERLRCSREANAGLFAATIGGMGLTGVIVDAELQLVPVESAFLDVQKRRYRNLDHFFELIDDSADWPFTVAWLDCTATGQSLGRGEFERARHAPDGGYVVPKRGLPSVPFKPPVSLINRLSIPIFNRAYVARASANWQLSRAAYDAFLYPLDSIAHWNRLYGRAGFFQFQNVVPFDAAQAALAQALGRIRAARDGSPLVVLKTFGELRSGGLLSFPRPGVTLAIDIPNRGVRTQKLLNDLARITTEHGGCLYPAKTALADVSHIETLASDWPAFLAHRDPGINTVFSQRLGI